MVKDIYSKKEIWKTADDLLLGYRLKNPKKHQASSKIFLSGRKLPSGNIALVKYVYQDGKTSRISTNVTISPEVTLQDHNANWEKVDTLMRECVAEDTELLKSGKGYTPSLKGKKDMLEFLDNVIKEAKEAKANSIQHLNYQSLRVHINICFENPEKIPFKTINAEWATKFCKYLCNEAENQNYQKAKDESRRKHVALSDNGQVKMWAYLRILLNKAIDEEYITENPCDKVKKNLLPKPKQSKREFLEVDELKRLINTPFPETRSKGELKEAFLFACFCGLRFSDLSTLTLSDIYEDTNGKYLEKTMIKTEEDVKVYLPDVALQLIPERERADNEPIFILPRNNNCNANVALKKWFENAGIRKHLTFHCPRHTFATVLLSNGEDIATVSKLLGHQSIAVTQVYADIVDKKKAEAKNRLNNIFA